MTRILLLIFILIVVAAGVAFAVLNASAVDLNYYFGTVQIPLSLVLVISFAVGAILGLVASLGIIVRLKRENRKLKRDVNLAEKEVTNLRNIPIRDAR